MDFDAHADRYQAEVESAVGVSVAAVAAEKARLIVDVLARELGDPLKLSVLDIGCGIGLIDAPLQPAVRSLRAVDTSQVSLYHARNRAPAAEFLRYDGTRLPFAD